MPYNLFGCLVYYFDHPFGTEAMDLMRSCQLYFIISNQVLKALQPTGVEGFFA